MAHDAHRPAPRTGGGLLPICPCVIDNLAAVVQDMELSEEEQLLIINRLHAVLRPLMLRRTKAEVASELPGKTERVVRCPLSAWQSGLYRRIATQRDVRDERGRSVTLSNVMVHLRKVRLARHPPFLTPAACVLPPGVG